MGSNHFEKKYPEVPMKIGMSIAIARLALLFSFFSFWEGPPGAVKRKCIFFLDVQKIFWTSNKNVLELQAILEKMNSLITSLQKTISGYFKDFLKKRMNLKMQRYAKNLRAVQISLKICNDFRDCNL